VTAAQLQALAAEIGNATRAQERQLFEQAVALLGETVGGRERTRWKRLVRIGARNECAVAIYLSICGECGFLFGAAAASYATSVTTQGLANTWRKGDAHAAVHQAPTPALALLRAAVARAAERATAQAALHCPECRGLGWFITRGNERQMCRHARHAA
jgi:hypothetical protein